MIVAGQPYHFHKKHSIDGMWAIDGGACSNAGEAAPAMLDGGVVVLGGKGMQSIPNSFCTKKRASAAFVLRRDGQQIDGGSGCSVRVWSTASTIVLRLGQGSF
jgi:hypothetical protein